MRGLLAWFSQIAAITWLNLKTLRERLGASSATLVGVAGVVMVFISVLSMAAGFRKTLESTGRPDTAIVLRSGSNAEMNSALGIEETRIISNAPGVLRDASGAVSSAELFVIVNIPSKSTGTDANVPLRGVEPQAFSVRQNVEIIEGRRFTAGRNEIIVGEAASRQFANLDLGSVQRWGENDWTVVGIFSAGGTVEDSEIWCDARVLQPAYRRGSSFQSVHLRLEPGASFRDLKDTLTTDPRLNIDITTETEYYAEQSRVLITIIQVFGYLIAGLMGIGAVFGALNTMYSAVASRTREIATLRAVGFGASPVVISVMAEALLLALVGGAVGAALAYGLFNGYQAATLNFQTFSQVAFSFAVTPQLLVQGTVFALVMGFVGGFFPAFRAARMPVATALRRV